MENKTKNKTYWPHMIVGFLLLALTLGFWTIKSASSMPVQQDNTYMMSYQEADKNINEIAESQNLFDASYSIKVLDTKPFTEEINPHTKIKQEGIVELTQGINQFRYEITSRDGEIIEDTNASFMLTRPHTQVDDTSLDVSYVPSKGYVTSEVNIEKPGRYMLVFRAKIGDAVGFVQTHAYLKPQE